MTKCLITTAIFILSAISSFGQLAVKTNLLYDATTTPNIGVEIGIGGKSTLNLVYGLNAWKFNTDTYGKRFAKHWVIIPEYRWWLCSRFTGHFLGAHLMVGQMNAANISLPLPGVFFSGVNLVKSVKTGRYQGEFAGAGLTYGYQWPLSRYWNLEAEIGVGYNWIHYSHYPCGECGEKISSGDTNYAGITKLGVSIIYVF